MVAPDLVSGPAGRPVRGGPGGARSWPCRAPGSGRAPSRSDAAGRPVGPCLMWLDTRGADLVRRAVGGPVGGYAPLALARWIRHSGGAPSTSGADPIGHMLFLEHALPEVARGRPLVPGAGRLPLHALHRGGRRLAGLDGRGLAHRQPASPTASPTTRCW